MTITGPGAGAVTVSGDARTRVFDTAPGTAFTISGLTIGNGFASPLSVGGPNGGAVHAFGSPADLLTLSACTFQGNWAVTGFGGGVDTSNMVSVGGCSFVNNTGASGGGGLDTFLPTGWPAPGSVTVTGDTFTGNQRASGGGVFIGTGTLTVPFTVTVAGCSFANNLATGAGGGLDASVSLAGGAFGTIGVVGDTFSGNGAFTGGGLALSVATAAGATATSTLGGVNADGNRAIGDGGGLFLGIANSGGPPNAVMVTASTFPDNTTAGFTWPGLGGGLFAILSATGPGPAVLTFTNNTIANSAALDSGSGFRAGGGIEIDWIGSPAPLGVTLTSNTIAGNVATTMGGGLFAPVLGPVVLDNNLVALNTVATVPVADPDVAGGIGSAGFNLIGAMDGSGDWVPGDLLGTVAFPLAPVLAPLGDGRRPVRQGRL